MVRIAAVVAGALSVGCGRIAFQHEAGDAAASEDAPCAAWSPFGAAVVLPGPITTVYDEWSPGLYLGDTRMMFHRYPPGGVGGELYVGTRAAASDPFGTAVAVTELDTPADQWTPSLTEDGLVIAYSQRGGGGFDLRQATRSDPDAPFGPSSNVPFAAVNSGSNETEPWLSRDGLRLVFSSDRGAGWDLYASSRPDRSSAFAAPTRIDVGTGDASDGSLSTDELELFFASHRAGGPGMWDVWTARRPAIGQPFGPASLVSAASSARDDVGPQLSADGRTLYFDYDTLTAGGGQADIWAATRTCP